VRLRRLTAILAMLGLLIGPSGGCLSLSMLNREAPDTKTRLDSLETRVSALEKASGVGPATPGPEAVPQFAPSPSH